MKGRNKHVLFIAFPFPPTRGAGVYRTLAMANFLVRRGWDVTTIAPHVDYFEQYVGSDDRSLMNRIDRRVDVRRIELANHLLDTRVGAMPLTKILAPKRYGSMRRSLDRYLSPLDHYPFWPRPVVNEAMKVRRKKPFDLVLATGNPFSSFLAAWRIGRRTGAPYVLDYRDAWTFDQFTGDLKPGASHVALSMERHLLHNAAAVISVNSPILDWLMDTHAVPRSVARMVVENGFDPEFAERLESHDRTLDQIMSDGARFSYVGTVIPDKLDWGGFLHRWRQAQSEVSFPLRLDMHGHLGFSARQASMIESLLFHSQGIEHHGSVPKTEVFEIYANSDALVLPMYESQYVTGGKTYEMMATGKPILAVGPPTAGAMAPLSGYPKLVVSSEPTVTDLVRGIEATVRMAALDMPQLDEAAIGYAEQFQRRAMLRPLVNLFDRLVP